MRYFRFNIHLPNHNHNIMYLIEGNMNTRFSHSCIIQSIINIKINSITYIKDCYITSKYLLYINFLLGIMFNISFITKHYIIKYYNIL